MLPGRPVRGLSGLRFCAFVLSSLEHAFRRDLWCQEPKTWAAHNLMQLVWSSGNAAKCCYSSHGHDDFHATALCRAEPSPGCASPAASRRVGSAAPRRIATFVTSQAPRVLKSVSPTPTFLCQDCACGKDATDALFQSRDAQTGEPTQLACHAGHAAPARRPSKKEPPADGWCGRVFWGGPVFRRLLAPFFLALFCFSAGKKERSDAYVERAGPQALKGVLGCKTLKPQKEYCIATP